ncbi:MAG: hypothetical protein HYT76_04845 [Deltaproteobacteria bacterium]|nr:hypothetical protein [Deltaproteobacteria bacterium]
MVHFVDDRTLGTFGSFMGDIGMFVASPFVPGLLPAASLVRTTVRCATGKEEWKDEAPRLVFGTLTTLPSLASGAYITPMVLTSLSKRIEKGKWATLARDLSKGSQHPVWTALQELIERKGIGRLAKAWSLLSLPLLLISIDSAVRQIYESGQQALRGNQAILTALFASGGNLTLVGSTFFFSGILPAPQFSKEARFDREELTAKFMQPREKTFSGSPLELIRGFRYLIDMALKAISGFDPKNNRYHEAVRAQEAFDDRCLWLASTEKLTVRGGGLVQKAVSEGKIVFNIQLCHGGFTDFVISDKAARLLGCRHGQLMKESLGAIGPLARVTSQKLGRQLVIIDRKDIVGGARQMSEGLKTRYADHEGGMVYTIYAPMTRTASGKNEMLEKEAWIYTRKNKRPERDFGPCGPDDSTTLWMPHLPPFQYALELARQNPGRVEVVFSTMQYQKGHTLVDFHQPKMPLERYTDRLSLRNEPLDIVAEDFRRNTISWMITNLVHDGSYFTRYIHRYYWIDQKGVLGKNIGGPQNS